MLPMKTSVAPFLFPSITFLTHLQIRCKRRYSTSSPPFFGNLFLAWRAWRWWWRCSQDHGWCRLSVWVLTRPLGSSIDLLWAAHPPSYHKASLTLRERLSQSRDGFQTTARQVEAASFTDGCVHLQIHSLTHFRTCVTKVSGTGMVSASSARRYTDRAAPRLDERNIHANEGFAHCGADLVLVRTVLEGADLNFVNAIADVHWEILPSLGEWPPKTGDTFEATPSHVDDPSSGSSPFHLILDVCQWLGVNVHIHNSLDEDL